MYSRPLVHSPIRNANQERCELEEYDFEDVLETYSLPVDAAPPLPKTFGCRVEEALSTASASTGSSVSNGLSPQAIYQKPVYLTPPRYGHAGYSLTHRAVDHLGAHTPAAVSAAAAAAAARTVALGARHDDPPGGCASCTCRYHSSKGCDRRGKPQDTKCRFFRLPVMGDFDTASVGSRRAGHHALKTVSIIETLSELAAEDPEVRRLAQEQKPPLPTRPPPGSRNAMVSSSHWNEDARPPGPPVVSSDFQQYTEKIYDAVTSRCPSPGLKTSSKGYRSQSKQHPPRRKEDQPEDVSLEPFGDVSSIDKELLSKEGAFKKSHSEERGRTPDWIRKIFEIAKKGDLSSLKMSLTDMGETLIRNLSDRNGNNLLHVMAVFGHLPPMAWLLTSHGLLVDALHDENKFGLTPLVCAIKYGRARILLWLVQNTGVKEKVKCKDGERSLLHIAAKYAQEEIVEWLVEYMMSQEISLDNKDHHGNTALHLAARTGNTRVCSILLQHGADVTPKNDLGQKAWEVCVVRGHLACAEYLCVHETGQALASDLTIREAELDAATTDNRDLKINFKEVASIARRLLREREDVVRELSRLHDHMVDAHDNIIMTLQALSEGNGSSKERTNGIRHSQHAREHAESVIAHINDLHERWQTAQKTWFGSSLVDMKHRMLLVEEAWKKLKHKSHRTVATTHHPLDVFRGKLCGVRSQGGEGKLGDLPSLCSSDESVVSVFPFSDGEDAEEGVDDYDVIRPPAASTPAKSKDASDVSNVRAGTLPAKLERNSPTPVSGGDHVCSGTLPARIRPKRDSPALLQGPENLEEEQNQISDPRSSGQSKGGSCPVSSTPEKTISSLNSGLLAEVTAGEVLLKKELRAKIKELALTSESGSCSVLEVIEPSVDDSDGLSHELRLEHVKISDGNSSSNHQVAQNGSQPSSQDAPRKDVPALASEGNMECDSFVEFNDAKHFLGNETSMRAAAIDVSESGQRPVCGGGGGGGGDHQEMPVITSKRKGFLHKFSIKPRWPSKRKAKSIGKHELGSKEFAETYIIIKPSVESKPISSDGDSALAAEATSSPFAQEACENSAEDPPAAKPGCTVPESTVPPSSSAPSRSREAELEPSLENVEDTEEPPYASVEVHRSPKRTHVERSSSNLSPPFSPSRRTRLISPVPEEGSLPPPSPKFSSSSSSRIERQNKLSEKLVSELTSVSNSEDSGILVRSSSSTSKLDVGSRPESSTSTFLPFKSEYSSSSQKSNLSLVQDQLPTPDSSMAGRMSPAPSEVSKTESALSPPSNASSDVSKSESARQLSLGKGSLGGSTNSNNSSKEGSSTSSDYSLTLLPLKKELTVKRATIIDISYEQNKVGSPAIMETIVDSPPREKKDVRPWYEMSDEESDILLPDRLRAKMTSRPSSSEDEADMS